MAQFQSICTTLATNNLITERSYHKMDAYSPTIVKETASKIDLLRCEKGLSIRRLASKAGVSKTTLLDIIQAKKIPNIYTLYNISKALCISLSDLFNEDDTVLQLRGKEAIVIKIFREISPMSQDTLIKVLKCMK